MISEKRKWIHALTHPGACVRNLQRVEYKCFLPLHLIRCNSIVDVQSQPRCQGKPLQGSCSISMWQRLLACLQFEPIVGLTVQVNWLVVQPVVGSVEDRAA